jgi:hypothetical protein
MAEASREEQHCAHQDGQVVDERVANQVDKPVNRANAALSAFRSYASQRATKSAASEIQSFLIEE